MYKDSSFRRSFYNIMQKLGKKYLDIYINTLSEL